MRCTCKWTGRRARIQLWSDHTSYMFSPKYRLDHSKRDLTDIGTRGEITSPRTCQLTKGAAQGQLTCPRVKDFAGLYMYRVYVSYIQSAVI